MSGRLPRQRAAGGSLLAASLAAVAVAPAAAAPRTVTASEPAAVGLRISSPLTVRTERDGVTVRVRGSGPRALLIRRAGAARGLLAVLPTDFAPFCVASEECAQSPAIVTTDVAEFVAADATITLPAGDYEAFLVPGADGATAEIDGQVEFAAASRPLQARIRLLTPAESGPPAYVMGEFSPLAAPGAAVLGLFTRRDAAAAGEMELCAYAARSADAFAPGCPGSPFFSQARSFTAVGASGTSSLAAVLSGLDAGEVGLGGNLRGGGPGVDPAALGVWVSHPPPPPEPEPAGGPAAPAAVQDLRLVSARFRRGRLAVRAVCAGSEGCHGRLLGPGVRARPVRLPANVSRTLSLRVSRRLGRRLQRSSRTALRLSFRSADGRRSSLRVVVRRGR